MDETHALGAFAALAQETRLRILRVLVTTGPEGLAAGAVAQAVGVTASTLSFHLSHLERAGLVGSRRESRSIIYTADYAALAGLIRFLMRDCCQGRPEICDAALLAPCCSTEEVCS